MWSSNELERAGGLIAPHVQSFFLFYWYRDGLPICFREMDLNGR